MATQIQNAFTQFELTEEEHLAGQVLNIAQIQVMQNLLAEKALARLNIKFDPQNPLVFAQMEAELSGAIDVLRYLLDCSEDAVAGIMALRKQQSSNEE